MITYFPEILPDELIYSWVCRCHVENGHITYAQTTADLFNNSKEYFDFLFINKLKKEIQDKLIQSNIWESIILKHTLFSYYARFLEREKKELAFEKLRKMEGNYINLLSITPRKENNYLRYCPMCANEQRKKYGFAYWRRVHQIPEMTVCPIHGCKIYNSSVKMDRHNRFFPAAEFEIENTTIIYGSELEKKLSVYVYKLLDSDIDIHAESSVVEYLKYKMIGTPYLSQRGEIINVENIYNDVMAMYKDFDLGLTKKWQISKLLNKHRVNPFEITQISILLGIGIKELLTIPKGFLHPENVFDSKAICMIRDGMSAYKVASELNVSPTLIRLILKNNGIKSPKADKYTTNSCLDKQDKIKSRRELWLNCLEKFPNMSYSKICTVSGYDKELHWLRRNDFEWTEKHYPKKYC